MSYAVAAQLFGKSQSRFAKLFYFLLLSVAPLLSPQITQAAEFYVFGPESFKSGYSYGAVSRTFSVIDPSARYILRVYNGGVTDHMVDGDNIPETTITLNGKTILGGDGGHNMNQNMSYLTVEIALEVVLKATNVLTVDVRGMHGGTVVVEVVGIDNVPPTITAAVAPTANAAGWHASDVVVTFTCSDGTSGILSCSSPVTVTMEGASQEVTGTAVDKAGNIATATVTLNIDKTAPGISAGVDPLANVAGWHTIDPTVSFACSDALSGIAACTAPVAIAVEGVGQVAYGQAQDDAGNTADTSVIINLDKTPPQITASQSPAANAYGWNNTNVTISYVCTDGGSGIASCSDPVTLIGEGANQVAVGTVTDVAGNSNSVTTSTSIDKTSPFLKIIASPAANAFGWHSSDVALTYTCSDDLSGIASCPEPGAITTEGGNQLVTASVFDKAGNQTTRTMQLYVDRTPPTITATLREPANAQGWHRGSVTVSFTCDDAVSGIVSCTQPIEVTNEGAGQIVTGTAVDKAGNIASIEVVINLDASPPTISAVQAPVANAAGWNNNDVSVSFECSDAISAVVQCSDPVLLNTEGAGQIVSGIATDAAGNTSETSLSISIDMTSPAIRIDEPLEGAVLHGSTVNIRGSVVDANPVTSFTINGASVAVAPNGTFEYVAGLQNGASSYIFQAVDIAGNPATQSLSVTSVVENHPPQITSTPSYNAVENVPYNYDVDAIDPEGDKVTYALVTAPPGMALDPVTGLVSWVPGSGDLGTKDVVVSAADTQGASQEQAFTVLVSPQLTDYDLPPGFTASTCYGADGGQLMEPTALIFNTNGDMFVANSNSYYTTKFPIPLGNLLKIDPIGNQTIVSGGDLFRGPAALAISPGGAFGYEGDIFVSTEDYNEEDPQSLNDIVIRVSIPDGTPAIFSSTENETVGVRFPPVGGAYGDVLYMAGRTAYTGPRVLYKVDSQGSKTKFPVYDALGVFEGISYFAFGPGGAFGNDLYARKFQDPYSSGPNNINAILKVAPSGEATILARDIAGYSFAFSPNPSGPYGEYIYVASSGSVYRISADGTVESFIGGFQDARDVTFTPDGSLCVLDTKAKRIVWILASQANNQLPLIVSTPPTLALAGAHYLYAVHAMDPNGGGLTFSLDSAPPGMQIDPSTGEVQWTPTVDQLGQHQIAIRATDAGGLSDTQIYTLEVRSSVNRAPAIVSVALTSAEIGNLYAYPVQAIDPDGDAIAYSLTSAPVGMAIDPASGLITWIPAHGQEGVHSVTLAVSDDQGGSALQIWSIGVASRPNVAPTITSTPQGWVLTGGAYVYEVAAHDADGDTLQYSLEEAPADMAIGADDGVLHWVASGVPLGQYPVRVRVDDGFGGTAFQTFGLHVVDLPNQAPLITSTPPWTVGTGQTYRYAMTAQDPDGDSIAFQLVQAPAGATIHGTTGELNWVPLGNQVGTHSFVTRVSDARGGIAEQRWSVSVMDGENRAPVITSQATTDAPVSEPYSYRVIATDADGDPLTYALQVAPAGMLIDAGGLISWVPDAGQLGAHFVRVTVSDGRGGVAEQLFSVWVYDPTGNHPPAITSTPTTTAVVGRDSVYAITATDPDSDTLEYSLVTAPSGMAIDSVTGVLTWLPDVAGEYLVQVRVSDGRAWTEQGYTLRVSAEDPPLEISLSVEPLTVDVGDEVTAVVFVEGGIDPVTVQLYVGGSEVALDAVGTARWVAEAIGRFEVYVEARDERERVAAFGEYRVRDPNDVAPPVAQISLPVDGSEISAPVSVIGTANDANIAEYRLRYAPARTLDYTDFVVEYHAVVEQELGVFDPTLLPNGLYDVELLVTDLNGNQSSARATYAVTGNLKVGHFSVTFEDLTVPLAGLPVTVTRTYDSRERAQALEFGYGWSIGYRSLRVQENMTPGRNWQINSYGGTFGQKCVEPNGDRRVTITLPDGKVERFRAKAQPECTAIVPTIDVQIVYESETGSGAQLESVDYGTLRLYNGDIVDLSDPALAPIDPRNYRLTTAEGVAYDIDQNFGVRSIHEPNGNTLTFSESGITHSSGVAISFVRDGAGRITAITTPDGQQVRYAYTSAGDLISFTDRVGGQTRFTYAAGHYLEDILDPRGVRAIRNEYDASGRLVAQIGPDGERIAFEHDLPGRTEVIYDALGNPTVYHYDERGNVLTETNALWQMVTRTYDAEDNELSRTDDLGNTTQWSYDARGNKLSEADALGRVTTFTYNARNQPLTEQRPDGSPGSEMRYDTNGNPTQVIDAQGNATVLAYSATGNLTRMTDALGHATNYAYDSRGNKVRETAADGSVTTFTYDAMGNVLTESTARTDANGVVRTLVTTHAYDANGRRIRTTDALGHTRHTEYNAIGEVAAQVDALGRRTEYEYDNRGRLVLTRHADGATESITYDAQGNKLSETSRAGETTRYGYDALNRLIGTTYPDGSSTAQVYDGAGRVVEEIDPNAGSADIHVKIGHKVGTAFC
jgi:YD repeat-containing protein